MNKGIKSWTLLLPLMFVLVTACSGPQDDRAKENVLKELAATVGNLEETMRELDELPRPTAETAETANLSAGNLFHGFFAHCNELQARCLDWNNKWLECLAKHNRDVCQGYYIAATVICTDAAACWNRLNGSLSAN